MQTLGWHSLGTSFECACGVTHSLPIERCHVGSAAARRLAGFAAEHCGKRCLVVSDENTRDAAGDSLYTCLSGADKIIEEKVFGPQPIDATEEAGEQVRQFAAQADFIVAIGSGTLSDLAKYAGDRLSIPVLLYPTAASMNGYTSGIVALKVRGLKRTIPCAPAAGVFADPEVVATAPRRMTAAGIADYLSKCSSSTDWRVAHMLHNVYFCERPREFFEGTQDRLLSVAKDAGEGDPDAVGAVMEALLLSGLSMVMAGSSAPASGGEHLISHYLDMKSALYNTPHDLHGAQVGVATIHCLRLWEKILSMNPAAIDPDLFIERQVSSVRVESQIREDWGPVAGEVRGQWLAKALTEEQLRAELERVKNLLPSLRAACERDLLPASVVERAIAEAGGPVRPQELTVPIDEYKNALQRARYIRDRFTVLDLAAHLCVS